MNPDTYRVTDFARSVAENATGYALIVSSLYIIIGVAAHVYAWARHRDTNDSHQRHLHYIYRGVAGCFAAFVLFYVTGHIMSSWGLVPYNDALPAVSP
jgi:hypothetical protein